MSLSSLLHWFYCLDYEDLLLIMVLASVFYLWLLPRILSKKAFQILNLVLLLISLLLILIVTLHSRSTTLSAPNLIPFHSYKEAVQTGNVEIHRSNLMNFLLFYPLGLFSVMLFKKGSYAICFVLLGALCLSIVIELIQYRLMLGHAEIDDVIHNTLGAFIGIILARISYSTRERNPDESGY